MYQKLKKAFAYVNHYAGAAHNAQRTVSVWRYYSVFIRSGSGSGRFHVYWIKNRFSKKSEQKYVSIRLNVGKSKSRFALVFNWKQIDILVQISSKSIFDYHHFYYALLLWSLVLFTYIIFYLTFIKTDYY